MENENIIFDYLQGKLSEEQILDFEQRLKSDKEFFEEYELVKQMHSYLRERNDRETYTAEVEKLGTKYFKDDSSKPMFSTRNILILAIAAIAILIAAWFMFKPQKADLYDSHAKHFALHLVVKSDNNESAIAAEEAFNTGDYETATTAIQNYLEDNAIDTKARLALGICHLETGKGQAAIEIFDEIRNGSSTLKDYGSWYAALYYVKQADYERAKEMLGGISERDVQLYKKGQELRSDIEMNSSKAE